MAFAKGKSYPILIAMAKKDNQAKKLLDNLASLSQEEFEKEFGELLGKHPELDNGTQDFKSEVKEQEPLEIEQPQQEQPKDEVPLWKKVGAKNEDDILFATKKIEKIGNFEPKTFDRPITKSRMLEDIDKMADKGVNGVQKSKDQYAKVRDVFTKWHPDNEKILPSPEEFNKLLDGMVKENDDKNYKSILRKSKKYPNIERPVLSDEKVLNIIKQNYKKALDIEPSTTNDISSSVGNFGGEMKGLEFRLKTEDSIKGKVERDFIEYENERKKDPSLPEKSREQIANEISDIVRYTSVFQDNNFVENVEKTFVDLVNKGYQYVKSKTRFYDGSVSKDMIFKFTKNGQSIELQFHTPTSFNIKMGQLHRLYEVMRNIPKDDPFYNEIDKISKRISTRVPNPVGIEKLTSDYFKELAGKQVAKTEQEISYVDAYKNSFKGFNKNRDKTLAKIEIDGYNELMLKLPKKERFILSNAMENYDRLGQNAPNFLTFFQDEKEKLNEERRNGNFPLEDYLEIDRVWTKMYNKFNYDIVHKYKKYDKERKK